MPPLKLQKDPPANDSIKDFYEQWSRKDERQIREDFESARRKAFAVRDHLGDLPACGIRTFLDYGCGYGGFLVSLTELFKFDKAFAFDSASPAIAHANEKHAASGIAFKALSSLDMKTVQEEILSATQGPVDAVALIDVLEHVPDCVSLIRGLAPLTRYFLIKLPVENSLFDNYVLPKEYPSATHSNGHVREFTADSVFSFVRKLGLTPVKETLYVYDMRDTMPPPAQSLSPRRKITRALQVLVRKLGAKLLPKKIFLRLIGGGGYLCLATYNEQYVLNP